MSSPEIVDNTVANAIAAVTSELTTDIATQVDTKLAALRATLAHELAGRQDACLTCSFQAEDVLLAKLAIEVDPQIPILFLDTGYHFAETYAYRDRITAEWHLNLTNLIPEKTVAEQESFFGLLHQVSPDQCCKLRKVEPLFKAVAGYGVWLTGMRREQAKSRAALEESAQFTLPGGKQVLKLAPLAEWSTRDVWYACEKLGIPLLPLYEQGYSSIGCEPCTSLPTDPNDPRSGRWAGRAGAKVECGIHIEAEPAK